MTANADNLNSEYIKLKQAVAEYQAILASALDPIITIDFYGIIHSASNSVLRVFGWKPEEIIGKNVKVLMPSPHREAHDGYLANYRRTGQTNILGRSREFQAIRKDGTLFPIELSVSRVEVPDSSEPLFTGIIHDISERHLLERELATHRDRLEELVKERTRQLEASHEQLRQADRLASIGTLAAGLGHDMNNVLLPIRARLDALDAADLPPRAQEQFHAVRRSIAYLQQLTDGLHLLALDPEDAEASTGSSSVWEWWNQVGPLLQKAVPKRVAFHSDVPMDLPEIGVAPHRLTQAMLNLVVNAGEAIHGEGMVRIWSKRGPVGYIDVGVTDTGEGMTPEVKQHALDPFFTTKKRGLGTGLGLSLVHGVVKSAGGSMDIDTEPGRGTTVTLHFPIAQERPLHNAAQPANCAVVSLQDRRAASLVETLLASAGFNVVQQYCEESPGPCRIWVVQPEAASVASVQKFLKGDRHRQVIIFGSAHGEWQDLDAVFVDDPTDFELTRRTIGQAILKGKR